MAAVDIYRKHERKGNPERITSMRLADLSALGPGEKLYMVAHGDGTTHGDRTAEELAEWLQLKELPKGNVVKLISCHSGDGDGKSFAARLGNLLDRKNSVIGIRGLETTEHGHTRASTQLPEEVMKEYDAMLKDDSFVKAEKVVGQLKNYLAVATDQDKVQEQVLKVAAYVTKLCAGMTEKIDAFFKQHVTTLSKDEAEYIHPALNGKPMGPSGFPASDFNPDYPGLEFSF
ncbi:MAG TPA: hypothetical protein VI636_03175 [Candidatus Angelobacter sp.]